MENFTTANNINIPSQQNPQTQTRKRIRDVLLEEEIGRGSYARVWKGTYQPASCEPRIVAIKEIDINKYEKEGQVQHPYTLIFIYHIWRTF